MNYHAIKTDDMLNGDGLRVVLFVSGCNHYCNGCHNKETWDCNSGKPFDQTTMDEIIVEMNNDHIAGLTLTGGDPLYKDNLATIYNIVSLVKCVYPNKTIWLYTGYKWEDIFKSESYKDTDMLLRQQIIQWCNVVVDDKYIESLNDVKYHWAGSTNQRIIDVKKTLRTDKIVLLD